MDAREPLRSGSGSQVSKLGSPDRAGGAGIPYAIAIMQVLSGLLLRHSLDPAMGLTIKWRCSTADTSAAALSSVRLGVALIDLVDPVS